MAVGKRREERARAIEHAVIIWTLATSKPTQADLSEFVRCGSFATSKMPFMPEVDAKVAEIERTGRLVIEN